MKIGINQSVFKRFGGFEEQIKELRSFGFDALDFGDMSDSSGSELLFMPHSQFEKALRECRDIADSNGIEICQTHSPAAFPPLDATPEERRTLTEITKRSLEGAAILGARGAAVHPLMSNSYSDLEFEKSTLELNLAFFSELADAGEEFGVDVCWENMPMNRYSLSRITAIINAVELINKKRLKVCLDTGHHWLFKISQGKAIRDLGDKLSILHVQDNDRSGDQHLPPYDGTIDWDDFAAALRETGFNGVLTLEINKREELPGSVFSSWLKSALGRAKYIAKMAE